MLIKKGFFIRTRHKIYIIWANDPNNHLEKILNLSIVKFLLYNKQNYIVEEGYVKNNC